jgi:acyl-coenzyme A thioesterase PaaI-like protein
MSRGQNINKIRSRVLRGIALNRTPGLHFPGNFLDISFDRVARDRSLLSFAPGPWCTGADGQVDLGALAILADLALAACMRARLTRATRLATVSLHLQFTGAPRTGRRLEAAGEFQAFYAQGAGTLGMSRVSVKGGAGRICYGTGSFMALKPPPGMTLHPVPHRDRESPDPVVLKNLHENEKQILARADAALASRDNFIEHFWGGPVLKNGLHAGNRVGHAQGGVLIGLAASSAAAALPADWGLTGLSAWYVSPGEGSTLRARSTVVHQGRLTAVVSTRITGRNRRKVLEVMTSHAAVKGRN